MDWPAYYHRYLDMLHKNQCYLDGDSADPVMVRQDFAVDLVDLVANHSRASLNKITFISTHAIS